MLQMISVKLQNYWSDMLCMTIHQVAKMASNRRMSCCSPSSQAIPWFQGYLTCTWIMILAGWVLKNSSTSVPYSALELVWEPKDKVSTCFCVSELQIIDCSALLLRCSLIRACDKVAFRCFDVHNEGCLQHDELFKMYKSLFGAALTDDLIKKIVFKALHDTDLETPGIITPEDFTRVGSVAI